MQEFEDCEAEPDHRQRGADPSHQRPLGGQDGAGGGEIGFLFPAVARAAGVGGGRHGVTWPGDRSGAFSLGSRSSPFCCHGQRPSRSTSREKLRNVRIRTLPPRTATPPRVGWVLIV